MDHREAAEDMTAERYLLEELSPEARDAFEDHLFDCPKCALDVRTGAALIEEMKAQLPLMATEDAAPRPGAWQAGKPTRFFSWLRPVFAVPAFAVLLLLVGYQNLVTMPSLKHAASSPRILPEVALYGAVRGGERNVIKADRVEGVALSVSLPEDADLGKFSSYAFELDDPSGHSVWTGQMNAPAQNATGGAQVSIVIPGNLLETKSYALSVSGVNASSGSTLLEKYNFYIAFNQ